MQAASSDVGLLDVDPVVIDELAGAVILNGVLADFQLLKQQADGDEIAIEQAVADFAHICRNRRVQVPDEFLDGHG